MRRISLITAMSLCIMVSQAQEKSTKVDAGGTSFGIRAGVNFQNINGNDESGNKMKNDILTAFNAGVNIEIPVATDFYFQAGLLYSVKGAKSKSVILNQTFNSSIKISYIELPLNFLYKPLLGSGHLLLGFGPYVAMGINGKAKYTGGGTSQSSDVKFKNTVMATDPENVVYFRRMDAGANLLAGYEFSNKLSFQLNAQLGLLKINPKYEGVSNDKSSEKKHRVWFFSWIQVLIIKYLSLIILIVALLGQLFFVVTMLRNVLSFFDLFYVH